MKTLTIYAVRVRQGNVTFYEAAMPAGNLTDTDYFQIDTWNYTNNDGYQREQNPRHVRKIVNYLKGDEGRTNTLPSNIVINFRLPLDVKDLGNGLVEVKLKNWPAYIIDGQHRIMAMTKAIDEGTDLEDYELPVTITSFALEEEMVQFRNLNYTASRPPKGLGQTITSRLQNQYGWQPKSWSEQAVNRAVVVTMRLSTDTDSPWYGKIALGGIRKRNYHTTVQASFTTSLEPLFITGRFADPNEDIQHVYKLIAGFWGAVARVWPEAMSNPGQHLIQRPAGYMPLNKVMGRLYSSWNTHATQAEIEEVLTQIRDNLNINDVAWGASAGMIKNLRSGYSESKANTIVADYLWGGAKLREKV